MSISGVIDPVLYLCSQKAHVQQFLSTEDALNKASEARDLCEKLMKRLHGGTEVSSRSIGIGSTSQNVGSLRQLEVLFIKTYIALVTFYASYIFFEAMVTVLYLQAFFQ